MPDTVPSRGALAVVGTVLLAAVIGVALVAGVGSVAGSVETVDLDCVGHDGGAVYLTDSDLTVYENDSAVSVGSFPADDSAEFGGVTLSAAGTASARLESATGAVTCLSDVDATRHAISVTTEGGTFTFEGAAAGLSFRDPVYNATEEPVDLGYNSTTGLEARLPADGVNATIPLEAVAVGSGTVLDTATAGNDGAVTFSLPAGTELVDVRKVGPSVTVDADSVTVDEGETATVTGTVSSSGDGTVSLSASVGTVTKTGDGTWEWSFGTSDGPDQNQTVTITATNEAGVSDTATFDLTVENVAPSATADSGSVTVGEGQTATVTGSFADPGDDTVALNASVGTVTKNDDGTWAWSFDAADGPDDSQTVTVTATDEDGATSQATFDLTVENVAPSVTADSGSVTVDEGQTATVTGSFADPGADVVTLSASVGNVTKNDDGTWEWSFETTDGPDQSQTVTITATDSDGATSQTTFDLTVENVAPSVAVDLPDSGVEGDPVSLSATIADPGSGDTHTATVDWGDGTAGPVAVDQGAGALSATHTYGVGGVYSVAVTVTDDDGASATVTDSITVAHVVEMDVKPGNGDETDPINAESTVTPVAIHTTDEFDAATVDVSTLAFGAPDTLDAGDGATPLHDGHLEDVDDDGDRDLVVHFEGDTGLESGDDTARVAGSTADGVPLTGTDAIRVVGSGDGGDSNGGNGNDGGGGNGSGNGNGGGGR